MMLPASTDDPHSAGVRRVGVPCVQEWRHMRARDALWLRDAGYTRAQVLNAVYAVRAEGGITTYVCIHEDVVFTVVFSGGRATVLIHHIKSPCTNIQTLKTSRC